MNNPFRAMSSKTEPVSRLPTPSVWPFMLPGSLAVGLCLGCSDAPNESERRRIDEELTAFETAYREGGDRLVTALGPLAVPETGRSFDLRPAIEAGDKLRAEQAEACGSAFYSLQNLGSMPPMVVPGAVPITRARADAFMASTERRAAVLEALDASQVPAVTTGAIATRWRTAAAELGLAWSQLEMRRGLQAYHQGAAIGDSSRTPGKVQKGGVYLLDGGLAEVRSEVEREGLQDQLGPVLAELEGSAGHLRIVLTDLCPHLAVVATTSSSFVDESKALMVAEEAAQP